MRVTKKQQEEIDFFCKDFTTPPEEWEIKEYIDETVHGIKVQRENAWQKMNRISESKRFLDISLQMWKEDLTRGMLGVDELLEDFKDYPYGIKLVNSVMKSISPSYRKEILTKAIKDNYYTSLCMSNFPEIAKQL